MDAQLKAKWVEALRSGEYKQGPGKLHDPETDSYCCLGVLCKIHGAEWSEYKGWVEEDDGEVTPQNYKHVPLIDGEIVSSGDDEELKKAFCAEIGIKDQSELIELNDGNRPETPEHEFHKPRKSFAEIADYIEKNL